MKIADELAPYRELARSPLQQNTAIVEGFVAVERMLRAGVEPTSILCTPNVQQRISKLVENGQIPDCNTIVRTTSELKEIVGFKFHRGCMAAVPTASLPFSEWSKLDVAQYCTQATASVLVVEHVADPVNVGALIRNARALSVDAVIFTEDCASPFSRQAIRASMGNVFQLPIYWSKTVRHAISLFRAEPSSNRPPWCAVAGTVSNKAVTVHAVQPTSHLIVVVGNEGTGLTDEAVSTVDIEATIPVQAGTDSFNVATAAALLLFALQPRTS